MVRERREKAEETLETKDALDEETGDEVNCIGSSRDGVTGSLFSLMASHLVRPLVKAGVMVVTLGLLITGLWGVTRLKMEFRPEWMLDPETECE